MARNPTPPQHVLCPVCGHRVVRAVLPDGRPIAINTGLRAYRLVLQADNIHYTAEESDSYPVHMCRGKGE